MKNKKYFLKQRLKKRKVSIKKALQKIKYYVTFKDASGWHDIIKPFLSKSGRIKLFEMFGPKAFLDPKNLRYPIVDPRTGEIHPKGVIAASFYSYVYGVLGGKKDHYKVFLKALNILRTKFKSALKIRGVFVTAVGKRLVTFFKRLKHLKL